MPPRYEAFESDLTSVPALFTWLVPKTGAHLPAALLHDGLVGDPAAPTSLSTQGTLIDRVEAGRIFRDGMADTGTGRRAGWIAGLAVGVLFHVTIAILAVSGIYLALEWLAAHLPPAVLRAAAAVVVVTAAILFAGAVR